MWTSLQYTGVLSALSHARSMSQANCSSAKFSAYTLGEKICLFH